MDAQELGCLGNGEKSVVVVVKHGTLRLVDDAVCCLSSELGSDSDEPPPKTTHLSQEIAVAPMHEEKPTQKMAPHALLQSRPPIALYIIEAVEHDGNLTIARAGHSAVERHKRIAQLERRRRPARPGGFARWCPQDAAQRGQMIATGGNGCEPRHLEGEGYRLGRDIGAVDGQLDGGAVRPQDHVLATIPLDKNVLGAGQGGNEHALVGSAAGLTWPRGGKQRRAANLRHPDVTGLQSCQEGISERSRAPTRQQDGRGPACA